MDHTAFIDGEPSVERNVVCDAVSRLGRYERGERMAVTGYDVLDGKLANRKNGLVLERARASDCER